MADNVIKEFLISLGVEANGIDKFDDQIDMATAKAVAFGEAMYDAAKEVARAVANMVTGFDQLYWQSKNLGSAAGDVRAMGFAFSELGGNAGMANAAMKSISDFTLSLGGGARSFLAGLGVDQRDIGDAAKTMRDLEVIFQRMVATGGPNALARVNQIAGVLGISSDQLRVMLRDSGEYEDQYAAIAKEMGVNLDDASKASNDLMIRTRLLQAQFDLWADSEGVKIIEKLVPYFKELGEHINAIASGKKLSGIDLDIRNLIDDIGRLFDAFSRLANSNFGQAFASTVLRALDDAIKLTSHLISLVTDITNGDWAAAKRDLNAPIDDFSDRPSSPSPEAASVPASPQGTKAGANNVIDFFKAKGAGDIQARGLAAMLFAESRLDPNNQNRNSGAYGIAQWLSKDRIDEFRRVTGHSIHNSTLAEQLRFVTYELSHRYTGVWEQMKRATSAFDVARIGIHGYEAPGAGEAGDIGRAAQFLGMPATHLGISRAGVSLSQQTNINIHGGGNSRDIANDVAAQQDAVNQRMVANAGVFAY